MVWFRVWHIRLHSDLVKIPTGARQGKTGLPRHIMQLAMAADRRLHSGFRLYSPRSQPPGYIMPTRQNVGIIY